MRFSLKHTDAANSIRMMSRRFKGLFILVEGLSDDRFYQSYFDEKFTRFIPAGGKFNVFSALELLKKQNNVIGIVDADYGETMPEKLPVFETDTHDHETLIIRSPAFDKFVRHFFDERKLSRFLSGQREKQLRDLLLDAGLTIGYVRMASQRMNYNLPIGNVDFSRFITESELDVDLRRLHKSLRRLAPPRLPNLGQLSKDMKNLRNEEHDPWRVVRGHDMTRLLSLLLNGQSQLNAFENEASQQSIEAMLRTSFEMRFFKETQLYQSISDWMEKSNWNPPVFAV